MMAAPKYAGPDRRSEIKFTREDSDRLVRLEAQLVATDSKLDTLLKTFGTSSDTTNDQIQSNTDRISLVEKKISWMMGIGTAVTFIISAVIAWFKGHG